MTEPVPNAKWLKQYAPLGNRLIPLCHWRSLSKQGKPLGKTPSVKDWTNEEFEFNDMVNWMEGGKNVGFRLGDGWGVLDYDPRRDPVMMKLKEENVHNDVLRMRNVVGQRSIDRLLADLGIQHGQYAFVETGGRGLHIYLRIPKDFRGREQIKEYPGVEFKHGARRYVVAMGSIHPGDAKEGIEPGNYYKPGDQSFALINTIEAPAKLMELFKHIDPPDYVKQAGEESFGRFSSFQLADTLALIPPETFRSGSDPSWEQFMMACHWMTGGTGREEFTDWSIRDPNYSDQDEIIRKRWDSLTPKVDSLKTGLVFKVLGQLNIPRTKWPTESASVMFATDLDDITAQELEGEIMPESLEAKIVKAMNDEHALVLMTTEPFYMGNTYHSLSGTVIPVFRKRSAMIEMYANRSLITSVAQAGGEKKMEMTHFDFWRRHPQRREYMGVDFAPGSDPEFSTPTGLYYNMWRGWPFDPDFRGNGSWDRLKEIFFENICDRDKEMYDYVMKWMAYSVQHPAGAQRVAFVMQGDKGLGKSMFANAWRDMFGKHGLTTDEKDDVFGRFNNQMSSTLALFLDEALFAGDKSIDGKVKQRINSPTIRVEEKYMPQATIKNHLKFMIASNDQHVVAATQGERRYVVTDAKMNIRKPNSIYEKAHEDLYGTRARPHTDGIQAMFFDLMHHEIGDFEPERDRVTSSALRRQVRIEYGDRAEWWIERIVNESMPMMFDPSPTYRATKGVISNWETRPIAVPVTALRNSMKLFMGERLKGELLFDFKSRFLTAIQFMFPETTESKRRMKLPEGLDFLEVDASEKGMAECIVLPPLPVCRAHIENLFGSLTGDVMQDFEADDRYGVDDITDDLDGLV